MYRGRSVTLIFSQTSIERQNNLSKGASTQPYLFVFIQVNSTMLLGDLGKLDTDITVWLPEKTTYMFIIMFFIFKYNLR